YPSEKQNHRNAEEAAHRRQPSGILARVAPTLPRLRRGSLPPPLAGEGWRGGVTPSRRRHRPWPRPPRHRASSASNSQTASIHLSAARSLSVLRPATSAAT